MTGTDLPGWRSAHWLPSLARVASRCCPYLDGERTPDRPGATGILTGLTTSNAKPENLARSAVEGVLGSLADAIDLLADCGVGFQHAMLLSGGARSAAIREIAPAYSAGMSSCRSRPSTSRSAPRVKRPGRWPTPPSRRTGRGRPAADTSANYTRNSGRGMRSCSMPALPGTDMGAGNGFAV